MRKLNKKDWFWLETADSSKLIKALEAQQWAAKAGRRFYADLSATEQLFGDPARPVFSANKPSSALVPGKF